MKMLHIIISVLLLVACSTTKKNSTVATPIPDPETASNPAGPAMASGSKDGIYPPGEEELNAIRAVYKEVDLAQLQEGHTLYTKGACINCHEAKNIYRYTEAMWKDIIDDMAMKAKITALQKDAVYKYVLAIKAKQP